MVRTRQIEGETYRLYSLIPFMRKRDAQRAADEIRQCGYHVRTLRGGVAGAGQNGWTIWTKRMG